MAKTTKPAKPKNPRGSTSFNYGASKKGGGKKGGGGGNSGGSGGSSGF